ncbi:MAG: arabinose efflux permease [Sedimentibacter sp.]|jgi:MFS family permease|nr:arabinose efflux permease [Sedimentibacter sp.]
MTQTTATNKLPAQNDWGLAVKAATLSIIILEYSISLSTPVLGAIAAAFPDVSAELIKQVQSMPSLTMIPVALLVGQIEKIMKKRTMLMIAIMFLFIGGIAPALGGGIYFILICRAIFGMGRGIVFPFAMSFIIDLFDGQERNVLMGLRSSTGSIAGIVFMQVGGFLGTINWRISFWGFLMIIPFALLIFFKLPEPEKRVQTTNGTEKSGAKLTSKTWTLILLNFILMFFAYTFMTNMAIVINTLKIGTPKTAANVMSVFTISSAVCGLLFGKAIKPLLKDYTASIGAMFIGTGILVLSYANMLNLFFVGAVLFGIGFSIYNTDMYLKLGDSADRAAAAKALSTHMAFNALSQFASPIVIAFIAGTLNLSGAKAGWTISGPVLLAGGLAILLMQVLKRTKNA